MMATGVARPNAHGQLITRTEIPLARANAIVSPARSQPIVVITAIVMTAGTNTPETLSAIFAIGAFVADHFDDLGERRVLSDSGRLAADKSGLV